MNTSDDRLTAPPPECCRNCTKLDIWTVHGVTRSRCGWEYVMAEGCPHQNKHPAGVRPIFSQEPP